MSETIKVVEGESPLFTFHIKERMPDGTTRPFSLDGVSNIYFRTRASRDDAAYEFEYTLGTGEVTVIDDGTDPEAEYSEITVQADDGDLDEPRNLWYKLEVETGARFDVVKHGLLEIANA